MSVSEKPVEAVWKPIEGLPEGAASWGGLEYAELVSEWQRLRQQLTDRKFDRTILDVWLDGRRRAFAIETGQIEGLYTLKRGITEQLIAEGLEGVTSAHTVEGLDDKTIKGLLKDQETTLEMVFGEIMDAKPLTDFTLKSWHQLLTRHQETVTGLHMDGGRLKRVQTPFERKGQYKLHPNNPRRRDGIVHEYCPPEHVQSEMSRLFSFYEAMRRQTLPTEVEAAWLHHRFVRIHPFQDGNGRVSRLLMAYVYLRKGEVPPVVSNDGRDAYIDSLERADRGDLKAFSDHLRNLAMVQLGPAVRLAGDVLKGRNRLRHGNGGVTDNGVYYPPIRP